ncbi:putative dynamin [Bombardia bombarda]|uniref:Dynamin n=1 Tax=Bombardia bombarda TaxID=252184 RepID=A0AA39TQW2_9PEZI|nr:putative dynamin [Bombardia bombarda]
MATQVNGYHANNTLVSSDRLHVIDQLREKNIGKYLPLPQLVAVGDQSSGKSSLLESLTGIPFPRGQELCTRYATQITHRREEHVCINITIIPRPNAPEAVKDHLKLYGRALQSTAELRADFPAILDEVNVHMGIRTSKNPGGDKTFAEDVLKIEKCGPDEDYLTVIDVPGIFRLTAEGVTTNQDKALVISMVKEYIRDERTIILAVLPANVDVFTQEILALAEEYDKKGERTLGVLTKPDLLQELSAKVSVCKLVEGKRKPLNLGYYVVRNRGGDDDDNDDAGSDLTGPDREAMFNEVPWRDLPKERLGVAALKSRLQDLLDHITDRAFPQLRLETRQMLADSQKDYSALGEPRQKEREQQKYLVAMAGKFQALVRAALAADYSAHKALEDDKLRIITQVVNLTEDFNKDFLQNSHAYSFITSKVEEEHVAKVEWIPDPVFSIDLEDLEAELEMFPELNNITTLDVCTNDDFPDCNIMDWIESMYRRSRGVELGAFGPGLLSAAFREQSVKWGPLTRRYLSEIILVIHRFILRALDVVCTDTKVREELASTIMDRLLARYEDGMRQADFLVAVERDKRPYTLNHYFNSNLQGARGLRIAKALKSHSRLLYGEGAKYVELQKVQEAVTNKSNTQHTKEDIHDILQAYYKVASKRFVDNVYHQAVDHCLLSGPMSPLALFSEQWVLELEDKKLRAIAAESRLTSERRVILERKIKDLEEAIEILQ